MDRMLWCRWSPADLSANASWEPQHQHVLGRVEMGSKIRLKERATIFLSCTVGNTASIT